MSQRHSGYERQANEHYATPAWVVQIAARWLRDRCSHIWAPADTRDSELVCALRGEGFHVTATSDDFFTHNSLPDQRIEAICTNPPFGLGGRLACAFIAHAIELAPIVVMLARIDFDSGKTRTNLFGECKSFAGKIVLLDRIVWFVREGAPGPSENHAWYLWDRQHQGPPIINYARKPKHV